MTICTEHIVTMWDDHAEACACILPAVHVFTPATDAHECTCGSWWYDREQSARARRGRDQSEDGGRPATAGP